jgi:hypothetical protein
MKVRTGYVSNSSSSSFIIDRYGLSQRQIDQILCHIEVSKELPYREDEGYDRDLEWCNRPEDAWDIEVGDITVAGTTFIDNFDMRYFLEQIGVADSDIAWGGH